MREYLLCLVAAAAVTYIAVPWVRRLALRWGVMAEVRDRDVHDTPTPRLGGLAM
ncbi:MAG: undecaprenyl/decaprenyl-phosphate alpha-N-acetylglucosaminyl 1-phosphate transferase, partial [Actinobacteria bacterium]|nr:undecaprenyl/decaprenyl-phosphate alpha-N-acetylglucosaminyl 1-phosphate transferase [Actinomycetota bacterium]